jgi:GGDEF domain-containing protein
VSPNDWPRIHALWIDRIDVRGDLGGDRERVGEYASDVVETLFVRPQGIRGALTRFGTRLGAEGWSLETVSQWIDALGDVCPDPPANYLRSFDSGVALAHGWTDGHLRGLRSAECFDGVTGLCTSAVLKLRLQQVFEQCSTLEIEPSWLYRLAIIDADISDVTVLEADAVMVVLADLVQRTFDSGETLVRDGGRIFVLASATDPLQEALDRMLDESRSLSLLHAARVFGWIEDLPVGSEHIERYMADLSV